MLSVLAGLLIVGKQLPSGTAAPNLPGLVEVQKSGKPRPISPDLLKGKVAIVDFWATWCAPCIATIPKMNELVERFKGKPVTFISISPEAPEVIAKFMGKTEMLGMIASDQTETTKRKWGIKFFPTAYIIGADGQIAFVIEPDLITPEMIEGVISGKFKGVGATLGHGFDPSRGTSFIEQMTGEPRTFRGGFDPAYDYVELKDDLVMPPFCTVVRPSLFKRQMGFHYGKNSTTVGATVINWSPMDLLESLTATLAAYIRVDFDDKFQQSRWDAIITRPLAGRSAQRAVGEMENDLLTSLLAAWQAKLDTREEEVSGLSMSVANQGQLITQSELDKLPAAKRKHYRTVEDARSFIAAGRGVPIYSADPSLDGLFWDNEFPEDGTPNGMKSWLDKVYERLGIRLEPVRRKEKIIHLVPLSSPKS
ncbi:MAG: redoxin domain-containing protein [Armatimonadetes bacterium]|nr:redoxin domain-containing protein [Armatimonadota bacterium]